MELPNVGVQCSNLSCKQLDFLPFKCKCGLIFCSLHFSEHTATCMAVHSINEPNYESSPPDYVCSYINCNTRSYVPLMCENCKQHFCVIHRHTANCIPKDPLEFEMEVDKFMAPIRQFKAAKNKVDEQLDNNIEEAKKKPKSRALANKVQLMRIKNKAIGLKSIPSSDRIYFNIQLRASKNFKEIPVFVSKDWTLGRVIDAIANECNLSNKNNQNNALKLRLFHKLSREIVSSDFSVKLEELLINSCIVDGEDLIFEYVTDECVFLDI